MVNNINLCIKPLKLQIRNQFLLRVVRNESKMSYSYIGCVGTTKGADKSIIYKCIKIHIQVIYILKESINSSEIINCVVLTTMVCTTGSEAWRCSYTIGIAQGCYK